MEAYKINLLKNAWNAQETLQAYLKKLYGKTTQMQETIKLFQKKERTNKKFLEIQEKIQKTKIEKELQEQLTITKRWAVASSVFCLLLGGMGVAATKLWWH